MDIAGKVEAAVFWPLLALAALICWGLPIMLAFDLYAAAGVWIVGVLGWPVPPAVTVAMAGAVVSVGLRERLGAYREAYARLRAEMRRRLTE